MMTFSLLCLTAILMEAPNLGLFPVQQTFGETAEDSDHFLQRPSVVAWHGEHGLYVLDQTAEVILHFNVNGSFRQAIGRPGEGPGEFRFGGFRPGLLSIAGDKLYVYNGQAGRIEVFDLDGTYSRSLDRGVITRLVNRFHVLDENRLLTLETQFTMEDDNYRVLALRDSEGNLSKELVRTPFPGWSHANNTMTFHAYRPTMTAALMPGGKHVLIGNGNEPQVELLNLSSGERRKVDVSLKRTAVDQNHRDAYLAHPRFQSPDMKADFPEYKPFYDHILALKDGNLLLINQVPFNGPVSGALASMDGGQARPFSMDLGDGGRLIASNGELFAIQLDATDEYRVHHLKLPD